jgi:hypothetical protein
MSYCQFEVSAEREKKFMKTFETMEELCHLMPITGLSRRSIGKVDHDDNFLQIHITPRSLLFSCMLIWVSPISKEHACITDIACFN